MLKSNTGSSTNANAKIAGKEAAAKAAAGLSNVRMAFVYASVAYDLDAMLAGIKEALPGVPLVGNTSFTGVITPEGFITGDNGFVGIMAMSDDVMRVEIAGSLKAGSARDTGKKVALEALRAAGTNAAPDYFYMVASSGEEESYLKGISEVIGRVPFFGGTAADNSISGEWKLYTDKAVFSDGVAVAFFYSPSKIKNIFTGAYRETGDVGVITKTGGARTLIEIDGEPAVKRYARWTGVDADSLKGGALLAATITSPLGVKDPLGDLVAIRHPMNGNNDYSMAVGSNLAEKTAVIRMEATVDELVESASVTAKTLKAKMPEAPAALHLVHCGGRRAGIAGRIGEVVSAVKEAAGDVPFIMEFTFGEYGSVDDGRNAMGGLMLSYTGFPKQ